MSLLLISLANLVARKPILLTTFPKTVNIAIKPGIKSVFIFSHSGLFKKFVSITIPRPPRPSLSNFDKKLPVPFGKGFNLLKIFPIVFPSSIILFFLASFSASAASFSFSFF